MPETNEIPSRLVEVLAVPHQLQGPGFQKFVDDPSYRTLLEDLISEVDFVFEEAAGHSPSVADDVAEKILGKGRYMDIDPPVEERPNYGLAGISQDWTPIDPCNSSDVYYTLNIEEQRKREELWVRRMQDQPFKRGLMICGTAHGLSVSFRLASVGFTVCLHSYLPFNKLCS